MSDLSITKHINAPVDRVFALFTDVHSFQANVKAINKIEVLSDDKTGIGKGTKWRETRTMFGKDATEILWFSAFAPNQRVVISAFSCGTEYNTTYTFTEVDGGTEVTLTMAMKPKTLLAKILGFIGRFMVWPMIKELETDMDDVKKIAERENT